MFILCVLYLEMGNMDGTTRTVDTVL